MKAIVCTKYGPPEVLKLKEVERPIPKKREICIKIFATAVTASDCIVRSFNVPLKFVLPMGLMLGFKKPRQPILGMVLAGEVDSIGEGVTSFKKGDPIFGFDRFAFGTYAEYKCISENGILAKKPANINFNEAAAIPYGGLLALPCLQKAKIQNGKRVLIYGASGAIGSSAVQIAKCLGATVACVCSTANIDLVKSLGAEKVFDYTKDSLTDVSDSYDLIFDAVGKRKNSALKEQCKKALAPKGKYYSIDDGSPKLTIENLLLLQNLVESTKIKPVIDRCYTFDRIVEAHRYVDSGHKKGNVIITVDHQ